MMSKRNGFTFIEILLAIAITAIFAVVVILAINPSDRFQDTRNARRQMDIRMILKAIHQYRIDNRGAFPPGLDDAERQLGTAIGECAIAGNGGCFADSGDCLDLSAQLAKYLNPIPMDPTYGADGQSFYTVVLNANNIVTVRACGFEGEEDEVISVSQ